MLPWDGFATAIIRGVFKGCPPKDIVKNFEPKKNHKMAILGLNDQFHLFSQDYIMSYGPYGKKKFYFTLPLRNSNQGMHNQVL